MPSTFVFLVAIALIPPAGAQTSVPAIGRADSTPAATTNASHDTALVDMVPIKPTGGSLKSQVVREIAAAHAAGKVPIVIVTEPPVCGPCRALEKAMKFSVLSDVLKPVHLIKVGTIRWKGDDRRALAELGYCRKVTDDSGTLVNASCIWPSVYKVDDTGHAVGEVFSPEVQGSAPEEIAKGFAAQFTKFLADARPSSK